jgi:hypothetical protein
MTERRVNMFDQQTARTASLGPGKPPAITRIDQPEHGANDADASEPTKLKCVDVLALVMLDSCAGG